MLLRSPVGPKVPKAALVYQRPSSIVYAHLFFDIAPTNLYLS